MAVHIDFVFQSPSLNGIHSKKGGLKG